MFDLIVRNATLPDGRSGLDIAIRDGKIAVIERAISAEAARVIDAAERLLGRRAAAGSHARSNVS